jgi:hypothetical protein
VVFELTGQLYGPVLFLPQLAALLLLASGPVALLLGLVLLRRRERVRHLIALGREAEQAQQPAE